MFSIMTMASSTTKPVAIVNAIKVRLLIEKPAIYMTAKVPTSDSGTATLGMMVADTLRRNTKITITTSAIDKNSSNFTSSTEARIVVVRSVRIWTSIAPGRLAFKLGKSFLMLSTTAITLAPGWRWMLTMIAADSLAQAPRRMFSAASTTSATSETRIGALFL